MSSVHGSFALFSLFAPSPPASGVSNHTIPRPGRACHQVDDHVPGRYAFPPSLPLYLHVASARYSSSPALSTIPPP